MDGESQGITTGQSVEVPAASTHTYANQSDQPVRFSAEHYPALGFEEYIRLVDREVAGENVSLPPSMRIVRIESSYPGVMFATPAMPRLRNGVLSFVASWLVIPQANSSRPKPIAADRTNPPVVSTPTVRHTWRSVRRNRLRPNSLCQ